MDIKKAVITAAGEHQRTLPLQSLVDRDGTSKTALQIVVEEVLAAGVEDLCVVVHPGDQEAYRVAAGSHGGRLHFEEQKEARGYGHAVLCARPFTGEDPFLLLVGDHLYVSREAKNCAQQLVEVAGAEGCSVSAVQATHESKLPYFGAVGGRLDGVRRGIYRVDSVIEKPTPTEAEQRLLVPGLRAGHYLCFFGMHVLTPGLMQTLAGMMAGVRSGDRLQLSAALATLAGQERYLAVELRGRRFDIGVTYGLLTAQLALALEGKDRDEVLSGVLELVALRGR